jgi:hypothetical protein
MSGTVGERIGEILVRQGACSAAAVREALQNQAIFGGRLGTNLLELGSVTEEALAFALGERAGAPALFGDLPPDPRALALVDARLADRWDVVPFLLADRRLAVLARDPNDLRMLDEVAFASGKSVHAFVMPEARLWRMLRRCYGLYRDERGLVAPRRPGAPAPAAPAAPPPDLMDEAGFQELYGQVGLTATPAPSVSGPLPAPGPGRAAPAPEAASPALPAPVTAGIMAALGRSAGVAPPASLAPLPTPAPVPEAEPAPLGFEEAARLLQGVRDRDAVARTVLRYARSRFRRTLLLTVRRDEAHGWAALGAGLADGAVRRLHLPLGEPGLVATAVATQAPVLGPIPRTRANVLLLKALGGGVPRSALALPFLALGRVVNVLYADNGRGEEVEAGDLGELLILATHIAQTYEVLARRAV